MNFISCVDRVLLAGSLLPLMENWGEWNRRSHNGSAYCGVGSRVQVCVRGGDGFDLTKRGRENSKSIVGKAVLDFSEQAQSSDQIKAVRSRV